MMGQYIPFELHHSSTGLAGDREWEAIGEKELQEHDDH